MKVGDCPSCRAPVEFNPGAGPVKVCEYCNTVVVRSGASLESRGKVAELVDTESPLKVGLAGTHSGAAFTLVGRLQKSNGSATWDEWCLTFDDGRTAWLSESEGEWNLMFPIEATTPPGPDTLRPLETFTLRERTFVVEEVGFAETTSAQGQLPAYNKKHVFIDATGPAGVFASLDYAEMSPGEAYVGNRVTLKQLGFDPSELQPTPKRTALHDARCTQCNGMLALQAPDAAKRVACPFCGALLDVAHGKLSFLQHLDKPPYDPRIPLGRKGTLDGVTFTALAFLIRSCEVEGTRYAWEEYLLWNRAEGFRWLMNANGHWTLLTPIAAGEVQKNFREVKYKNESYRAYQEVYARTDYVAGECYWQVQVGELARATEYISPPKSVNLDFTDSEATYTFGVLLASEVVEKAFALEKQPAPTGIAPAQLNPHKTKASEGWVWSAIWGGVLLVLMMVFAMLGTTAEYYRGTFTVPAHAAPGSPESQQFSEPFEIKKKVPLEVHLDAPGLDNNWLGVDVALVNTADGEVISVYAEPSYYSGVDDGERWSEGSRDETKQTDVVDPGMYMVRVTPQYEAGKATDFSVRVNADDGPGFCCPCFIFILLLLGPIFSSIRASGFETERWNESVFQSAPGVSTFPHAKVSDDDDDDE
ncbi:MAG: DUF4178 domain-containing protein [Archangium sp.]|nr:DUF4178 domain-containing protein [Archangium sp.]